ncbi:helix-turn-helix transcriptional regulator [Candidatus Pacearchaeota archaeon]|nr:helix-turn-helix transcriptional regulator [Candidatus Pacearchaeota archaeon]
MADDKFLLVSMDDERAKSLADVLGSKSCKKIIEHLAENDEASEKDLADSLHMPLNTVEYNLKKLMISGFVEKKKKFFWSKKGKKILTYGLSNKSIVISSKKSVGEKVKSILPSLILLFAGTVAVFSYEKIKYTQNKIQDYSVAVPESTNNLMMTGAQKLGDSFMNVSSDPVWPWFMIGGLLALLIFSIVNWRKL